MQINNTNSPNFTSIRIPQSEQKYFIKTIRNRCDSKGLKRIYKALVRSANNTNEAVITEFSNGRPRNLGFLRATVDGETYTNDVIPTLSFWSVPHFIEKIARLTEKKFDGEFQALGKRMTEVSDQISSSLFRLIDEKLPNDIESAEFNKWLNMIKDFISKQ